MNFSAVILAGGKSSRMGCDKAWLEIQGETLLARQVNLARKIGALETFISGRPEKDYSEFGCPVLRDKFADAGPLAGIERALAAASCSLLLVLAVDMPALKAGSLKKLAAVCAENHGAIPRWAGKIEPLAAFYPKSSRFLAENLLRRQANAVTNFARGCVRSGRARFVELSVAEATVLANWNSPEDARHRRGGDIFI
jgi:molybdopterin-guanine dinucleotide biosynthesis protein A